MVTNKEHLWPTIDALASTIQRAYSVTDTQTIRSQYLKQVAQYPLYREWFNRIMGLLGCKTEPLRIVEYGPGPGILAERLANHPRVGEYTAVDPEQTFLDMTKEQTQGKGTFVHSTAEEFSAPQSFDLAILTATYHHFSDKVKALKNIRDNLTPGGQVVIAEVFIPPYGYDAQYNPTNHLQFVERTMEYAAEQILAMPRPEARDIIDQIKTSLLDILRVEELKVCLPILLDQLKECGFVNIKAEQLRGTNTRINYNRLGYHLITAETTNVPRT